MLSVSWPREDARVRCPLGTWQCPQRWDPITQPHRLPLQPPGIPGAPLCPSPEGAQSRKGRGGSKEEKSLLFTNAHSPPSFPGEKILSFLVLFYYQRFSREQLPDRGNYLLSLF